eukprot:221289-Chlamydomonas_euryale.AAC.4
MADGPPPAAPSTATARQDSRTGSSMPPPCADESSSRADNGGELLLFVPPPPVPASLVLTPLVAAFEPPSDSRHCCTKAAGRPHTQHTSAECVPAGVESKCSTIGLIEACSAMQRTVAEARAAYHPFASPNAPAEKVCHAAILLVHTRRRQVGSHGQQLHMHCRL